MKLTKALTFNLSRGFFIGVVIPKKDMTFDVDVIVFFC
jgi:hypothetical protein